MQYTWWMEKSGDEDVIMSLWRAREEEEQRNDHLRGGVGVLGQLAS